MKNIILSIKYKYAKEIIERKKLYEFRGWIWKNEVQYVYIYSSKEIHKIIARFKVEQIIKDKPNEIWAKCRDNSGVSKENFFAYVKMFNYRIMYAVEIAELEILQPNNYISLSQLNITNAPQKFKYLDESNNEILERLFNE